MDSPLGRQVRTSYSPTGHYPLPWDVLPASMCVGGLVDCFAGGRIDLVSRRRRPHACNEPIPSESRFTETDRPPRQASTCPRRRNPPRPPGCSSVLLSRIVNNFYHRVDNDLFTRVHQRTDFYDYLATSVWQSAQCPCRVGALGPAPRESCRPSSFCGLRWLRIGPLELGLSTCERSVSCDRLV